MLLFFNFFSIKVLPPMYYMHLLNRLLVRFCPFMKATFFPFEKLIHV